MWILSSLSLKFPFWVCKFISLQHGWNNVYRILIHELKRTKNTNHSPWFQTVANMVDGSFIEYTALKFVLNHYKEHLFEEFTVGGYLWGYEEKTLAAINNFTQKYLGKKFFSSDKFGLFYGVCIIMYCTSKLLICLPQCMCHHRKLDL